MDEPELVSKREEIEARFKESGLADACVNVAKRLGEDRGSRQGECYTNENYFYKTGCTEIDCDIGMNIQGDGKLIVRQNGRHVLRLSGSYPENDRKDLPQVAIRSIRHTMVVYEPGDWEKVILNLRLP